VKESFWLEKSDRASGGGNSKPQEYGDKSGGLACQGMKALFVGSGHSLQACKLEK
jgi:hypothetical protein